jgi:hypothetical protein
MAGIVQSGIFRVDGRIASGLSFQPCGEAIGGFVEGVASDPSRSTRSSPSFSLGGGKTTGFLESLQSTALGDCLPTWRRLVLPWLGTASPTPLWVEARLRLALPPHCPGAALRLFSGDVSPTIPQGRTNLGLARTFLFPDYPYQL